jgi:hypothetical protein
MPHGRYPLPRIERDALVERAGPLRLARPQQVDMRLGHGSGLHCDERDIKCIVNDSAGETEFSVLSCAHCTTAQRSSLAAQCTGRRPGLAVGCIDNCMARLLMTPATAAADW